MAGRCRRMRIRGGTATRPATGRATRWWLQSAGFRDLGWLDVEGSPLTDAAHVTERFRRPDFGHLDIEVTIDDPKAYTKPWTVAVHQHIMVDTELIEFVCQENEQDAPHLSASEAGFGAGFGPRYT